MLKYLKSSLILRLNKNTFLTMYNNDISTFPKLKSSPIQDLQDKKNHSPLEYLRQILLQFQGTYFCRLRAILTAPTVPGGRWSMRLIYVTQRPGQICRNSRIYKSGVLLRPPVVIYVAHF